MANANPNLVVLAGPNGAGKSTVAPILVRETLGITNFINADEIARGLSAYNPESVAIAAGRIMLAKLKDLASKRADFAFETTLASKTFAPWIRERVESGYSFRLYFVFLPSADAAVRRVRERITRGGHADPEETIRRRYEAGLRNFFSVYQPLTTSWEMIDNTDASYQNEIARGHGTAIEQVFDARLWEIAKMSVQKVDIDDVFEQQTPILDAFRRAFETVVHDHAWRGLPIIGWRDGKVTYTDPFSYYKDGTVPLPSHLAMSITDDGNFVIIQRTPITGPDDGAAYPSPAETSGIYPLTASASPGEVRS